MEDLLSGLGVNASIVNILNVYYLPSIRRSLLFVSFEIILSSGNEPLANFTNYITNNLGINGFGGFPVDDNSPIGFQGVAPTGELFPMQTRGGPTSVRQLRHSYL